MEEARTYEYAEESSAFCFSPKNSKKKQRGLGKCSSYFPRASQGEKKKETKNKPTRMHHSVQNASQKRRKKNPGETAKGVEKQ